MKRAQSARGFTLIELMIVVAIIGVLAALAIPAFNRYIARGKLSEAKTMLQGIKMAQESYRQAYGRYTHITTFHPTEIKANKGQNEWKPEGKLALQWKILGAEPNSKYTYFQYAVGAGGPWGIEDVDDEGKQALGEDFLAGKRHWWVAVAKGDLDNDGDLSTIVLNSERDEFWELNELE